MEQSVLDGWEIFFSFFLKCFEKNFESSMTKEEIKKMIANIDAIPVLLALLLKRFLLSL